MVIPDASEAWRHSVRSGWTRVISGMSAAQPYHSPSRWMPSIVTFSRERLSRRCCATFLHNELAPPGRDERTDPAKLAIIAQIRWLGDNFTSLQHRLSVVRIRALRPAFLKSMTIPLSKEERASPETQQVRQCDR